MATAIRLRRCPALVGTGEAAKILGVRVENIRKITALPPPLQDREIAGFEVAATSLWVRSEIEILAAQRASA